jgi:hypothetical protein
MSNAIFDDRTKTSADTPAPAEVSQTRTIGELLEDLGHLRSCARLLGDDVAEIHHDVFWRQLDERARRVEARSPQDMLGELADRGFAWRDIATLVGVSVPALRRWRQGESPTGGHRLGIARVLAFVEILEADHLISVPASWLEMPLSPDAPVSGVDLATAGRYEDLLDLAAGHASAAEVLDRWQPDWRTRYRSDFEVFEAPDGEAGIRSRRRT